MFNKNACDLYYIASCWILSTFTSATFITYITLGWISLGVITLRHFFVPAFFSFQRTKCVMFQYENNWGWQVSSKQLSSVHVVGDCSHEKGTIRETQCSVLVYKIHETLVLCIRNYHVCTCVTFLCCQYSWIQRNFVPHHLLKLCHSLSAQIFLHQL